MASVDRDTLNPVRTTTDVHAGAPIRQPFDGAFVFGADAFPAFAMASGMKNQTVDAACGRAINGGRGVVGEGGDTGPGVVGIAGNVISRPLQDTPRDLQSAPFLGRGMRVGVVGFGTDPASRGERAAGTGVGVLGVAARSLGVWGMSSALPGVFGNSNAHAGVYGSSQTTGVFGDGNAGQVGVEGTGNTYGVYGHVNFANPNADGVGVFGAAAITLGDPNATVGRAGVFVGPVDVVGNLTVTGDLVVWGPGKAAAARHSDGTHRLLYCVESPESQFEDFGEARLVKGRAKVRLDPDFVGVSDTRHYHVFLTPYGDSKGLYVSSRNRKSFEVREQGGGTSTMRFSYRIVARRRDAARRRFQKVTAPKRPQLPAKLVRPDTDLNSLKSPARRRRKRARSKR